MVAGVSSFPALASCEGFGGISGSPQPTRLVFLSQPPASMVATESQPPVRVAFTTDDGHVLEDVRDSVRVVVIGAMPTQMSGTTGVQAQNGVATFNVRVLGAGTGYRFEASTPRFVTTAVSEPFAVVHGPAARVLVSAAADTIAIGAIVPISARITDAVGNQVLSATDTVTLSTTGALHGTTTAVAVGGLAQFPDVKVCASGITTRITPGTAVVQANASGLAPGTATFTAYAGSAIGVAWVTQPGNGSVSVVLPEFRVVVHDCGGNPVYGSLVLGWGACSPSLHNNPSGASIVSIGPGYPMVSSWAYATNYNAAVDRPGSGYTMVVTCAQASPGSLRFTSPPSAPFDVLP